jgi:hypothetical protein
MMNAENRWVAGAADFPLADMIAATRPRLFVGALILVAANAAFGAWNARMVMEVSGSVGLNLLLISLQFALLLTAGYAASLAVGVLVFGDGWRRYVICSEPLPPDVDLERSRVLTRDRTLAYWAILVASVGANYASVAMPTDHYIQRYNRYGFFASMLRSGETAEQVEALRSIAEPSNLSAAADPAVRAGVRTALDSPESEVRTWAAWVAGRIILVEAGRPLSERLESIQDADEFLESAGTLGLLRDPFAERQMAALVPAAVSDPPRLRALLRGLGLTQSADGAHAIAPVLARLDPSELVWALWLIGETRDTQFREPVLAGWQRTGDSVECIWAEALKHVTTVDDIDAMEAAFQAALAAPVCEPVVHIGRAAGDDVRERTTLVVGEPLAAKYLKAIVNIAGPGLEPWLESVRMNTELNLDVRLLAQDVLEALENEPGRQPRR